MIEKAKRRRLTPESRFRIVPTAGACKGTAEMGACRWEVVSVHTSASSLAAGARVPGAR